MDRQTLYDHIKKKYRVSPDYPWKRYPANAVFRHTDNRKWFAIAMTVPYRTVGIGRDGPVDILNAKCDPVLMGSLRRKPGFCPAYHMNKDRWITVLLDGSAEQEDIAALLSVSFNMTAAKIRRAKHVQTDEKNSSADQ